MGFGPPFLKKRKRTLISSIAPYPVFQLTFVFSRVFAVLESASKAGSIASDLFNTNGSWVTDALPDHD